MTCSSLVGLLLMNQVSIEPAIVRIDGEPA